MALRHAAVLRNPGSYVMSPTSSADVLICRRSTARIAPSWIGISYCLPVRLSTTARVSLGTRGILDFGWGKITTARRGKTPYLGTHMTSPAPKPTSLYPTRSAAGALLGQQLAARGFIGCILLGVTPEGVEIAANAAKAMGAQFDVLVAAFIKLGSNLAPIGAIAEAVPSEIDPDFQPSGALIDKLSAAIEESRARVSQDLILYRTQRPVKALAGEIAVIVAGQVIYPWRGLPAGQAAEQLSAQQVVLPPPGGAPAAARPLPAPPPDPVRPAV